MEPGATAVYRPQRPADDPATRAATRRRRAVRDLAPRLRRTVIDLVRHGYWRVRGSASARALRHLDEIEAQSRLSSSLYHGIFDQAPVAMALLDTELRIVDANRELVRMIGRPSRDLLGLPVDSLASQPKPARLSLMAQKAASGRGPAVVNHRYHQADGNDGWARTSIQRLEPTDGVAQLMCVIQDITHDRIALEEQRREAERDPLTGLLNRRGGDRRLRAALERMAESGPVAVIVCDADRFKEVNDQFGHAAGDELLAGMAGRLRSAVRSADEVARMGGDEFVVVARVADEQEAVAIAERCVRTASGPFRLSASDDQPERVTLSAGVAVAYPGGPVEPGSLVAAADRALYAAKAAGGGCWKLATAV